MAWYLNGGSGFAGAARGALVAAIAMLAPATATADVIISVGNPGAQVPGRPASTILYSDLKITLNDGTLLPTIAITDPMAMTPYVPLNSLRGNVHRTTVPGVDMDDIRTATFSVRRTPTSTRDEPTGGLRGTIRAPQVSFETPGLLDGTGALLFVLASAETYQRPPDIGTPLVFTGGLNAAVPDWTVYTSFDETTGVLGTPFTGSATVDFLFAASIVEVPEPASLALLGSACGLLALLRAPRRRGSGRAT